MWLRYRYDHWGPRSLLIASIFWMASAATLHSQLRAVFTGPRAKRVVWDVPREQVISTSAARRDLRR